MKLKAYLTTIFAALALLNGCYDDDELWDAVNTQEQRIAALETWQKTANSNIEAMQTLVSGKHYITEVTPITLEGKTVGYTIAFNDHAPVTIYNGEKGDKGDPGTTPAISIAQAEDGNWYWTLNGSLMKDAAGNPIRANGTDGQDGNDGDPGQSAPAPVVKTGQALTDAGIAGTWTADAVYLSVDAGKSWTQVSGRDGNTGPQGPQGPQGTTGSQGPKGDSMFSRVTVSTDQSSVLFELADGWVFQVPLYKFLTLKYTYKPLDKEETLDPAQTIALFPDANNKATIACTIQGTGFDKTKVKVSASITSGSGWKASVDNQVRTITFTLPDNTAPAEEATVTITATDNAGQSCSYILNLKKTFGQAGSESDPYIVFTPQELQYLARRVNAGTSYASNFFVLWKDIDLTGIEWIPIGTLDNPFRGTFDGKGYDIRGLKVDQDIKHVGLFGVTDNATLKNITLISPKVEAGNQFCGSLVGYGTNTTIENCHVTDGYCSASEFVGGLIGVAAGKSTITNCHVKNTTVTANSEIGGLIGSVNAGTNTSDVTNCSATGCELNAQQGYCGGLIGLFYVTTLNLTACYATGSIVSPNDRVGALLGGEFGSKGKSGHVTMTGCYSTIPDPNNVGSFTLQGAKTENGTSTFKACYYITSQPAGTATGVTVQPSIDATMIAAMNTACGHAYYKPDGTLKTEPQP